MSMSTSARIMMLTTWAIVAYFCIHFFIKVARAPQEAKALCQGCLSG